MNNTKNNTSSVSTPDQSKAIVANGTIRTSTQLPVLTVDLGPVGDMLGSIIGVIEREPDGSVRLYTKEHPEDGFVYDQELHAVVRVIGDHVLDENGKYDIYCPSPKALEKAFTKGTSINSWADTGLAYAEKEALFKVLACASKVRVCITAPKTGRKVVEITSELIQAVGAAGADENGEYLLVHESYADYDPESRAKLHVGDVFLIEHDEECSGYPIDGEVFYKTEVFTD